LIHKIGPRSVLQDHFSAALDQENPGPRSEKLPGRL
jgi:hypothetical protein